MPDALSETQGPPPRTQSRETRRAQIIEATIATLATRGFARTTLTEVARNAGLSHGLVLFHFSSKDGLLADTLAHLAEEYRQNWQSALAAAGDDPAAQLTAMIRADFLPTICTQPRLAAWCAYWGEAQSRPLYQETCGETDADYEATLTEICTRLNHAGGYGGTPARMARILSLTLQGTWMDLMMLDTPYSVAEALATAQTCAAHLFPRHFAAPV